MREVIAHLNYLHVLVVAVAGFIVGCLWSHGPLFGKAWMAEMKLTQESMEAVMKAQGMGNFLIKNLCVALLSTLGFAALIALYGPRDWLHGAAFGAFVGLIGPGIGALRDAAWTNQSLKLQAINLSHEIVVYAVMGAILGAWH